MLIEELYNFSKVNEEKVDAWYKRKAAHTIVIDPEGTFIQINLAGDDEYRVPRSKGRSSDISAEFLCDGGDYVLGFDTSGKNNQERLAAKHQAFIAQVRAVLESGLDLPEVQAILSFYTREEHTRAIEAFQQELSKLADRAQVSAKTQSIMFRIADSTGQCFDGPVHLHPALVQYWHHLYQRQVAGDGPRGLCFISGESDALLAPTHPKVMGRNSLSSLGASLVSFEAEAVRSHGQGKSASASMSADVAIRYTGALSYLLDSRNKHVHRYGPKSLQAYWYARPDGALVNLDEDVFGDLMAEEQTVAEEPRQLWKQAFMGGGQVSEPSDTLFHALQIVTPQARIAVRDIRTIRLDEAKANLSAYLRRIHLPTDTGMVPVPVLVDTVFADLKGAEKDRQELKHCLICNAIYATPIPDAWVFYIVQTVVRQIVNLNLTNKGALNTNKDKAQRTLTNCMRLLRLVLPENMKHEREKVMEVRNETLDLSDASLGFVCGAIFAVACWVQEKASKGSVKAGFASKLFQRASQHPDATLSIACPAATTWMARVADSDLGWVAVLGNRYLSDLYSCLPQNAPALEKKFTPVERGRFCQGYHVMLSLLFKAKPKDSAPAKATDTELASDDGDTNGN